MKRRSLIAAGSLALASGVVVSIAIYHWRPLLESPEIVVSYSGGAAPPRPGTAYRMLFRPDRVFVRLPDHAGARHPWLAADLSRRLVAVPNDPSPTPYLHFNHDMALGVAADNAVKLATPWTVSWDASGFTLTSGDQSLRVECR